MNSSRPYLVRAIHEWLIDNDQTPYLLVNTEYQDVQVPVDYVQNGKIVLNVSTSAVELLHMDNNAVSFNARFGGNPMNIYVPISACMAIYSKENGQGMVFKEEQNNEPKNPDDDLTKKNLPKPSLKIVK